MKTITRLLSLTLAAILVWTLAVPGLEVHAAENTVEITLDGYENYSEVQAVFDLINTERKANGVPELTLHPILNNYAMQRAAEVYVYYSHTRPDGTECFTVMDSVFLQGDVGENIALGQQNAAEVMTDWMNSPGHRANILSTDYKSVGIGCFYQPDGSIAWVQLFSSEDWHMNDSTTGAWEVKDVSVLALPENLAVQLNFQTFSNAFCEAYLYDHTTVGTGFSLLNRGSSKAVTIEARVNSYSYTTSDPDVFTVDNEAHTIIAQNPGKATLGVQIDGMDVDVRHNIASFFGATVPVEVLETPELTYEIDSDGTILINYGEFSSSVSLYFKGNHDELWTAGNWEADGIFEHFYPDPTETYLYIMRYYDEYLEDWVNVSDYLVVQLGDEEPIFPEEPEESDPTEPTEPDELWIPTPEELPQRESEPTLEEVDAIISQLQEIYPAGTDWPSALEYSWHADAAYSGGLGTHGFPMLVSDLIFGDLPGRIIDHVTVDDLRPGDVVFRGSDTWLVTGVAPDYIQVAYVRSEWPDGVIWFDLFPSSVLDRPGTFAVTRYTSEAPGAAYFYPSIVPEDAVIVDQGDCSVINFDDYWSVLKWTLTDDGTLYLYGIGHTVYNDDTWRSHKDEIRRVVVGPNVDAISDDFQSYPVLEEVILGEDVQEIWANAFEYCTNLKRVEFGSGLTEIGEEAFRDCGLEELVLPEGLEIIGDYAFVGCESLRSVSLPASITEMGVNVFTSCTALTDIHLAEGLTLLGWNAFSYTDSLKTVTLPGSLKELPPCLFECSGLETVYLSQGTEVIRERAFYLCRELKELHLPNTLTTVESCAFDHAEEVTDIWFYGTEAQWDAVEIDSGNDCLIVGWYWPPVNFHFVDPDACRHANTTVLPVTEPTCTEDGLTEGVVCNDCGEMVTAQETIPAIGHDYAGIVTEPTCTEGGHTTYTCRSCGDGYVGDYTEALGHEWNGTVCDRCGVENENPFTDVKESDFFYDPVLWAVENGITAGTGAGVFSPNLTCTRAQVVTFLWRAMGKPAPSSSDNPFGDVKPGDYYYDAVLWAVEQGITAGTGVGTFSPDRPCTRDQVVTFLWRAMGKPAPESEKNPFTDVDEGMYYYVPVLWAVEEGITAGVGANTFAPGNPCTRAQVVTFLYRAMTEQ